MKNLCNKNCSLCSFFERCGGCSLCEASICNNNCVNCGTLCFKRGNSIQYLKTLDLSEEVRDMDHGSADIPYYIPVFPDKLNIKIDGIKMIGVHGANFLSQSGEKVRKIYREKGFREALNIDKSVNGILQFYIKDRSLEGAWDNRKELYRDIVAQNFKFVIAPNFSVYDDCSRLDHMYNINRSIIFHDELLDKGIRVIQDISWYNINDLNFWIERINKSNSKIIAFSFQTVDVRLKAYNGWKHYLAGFKYLCSKLSGRMKIIIIGISSYTRINEIKRAAESAVTSKITIHILNQAAYIHSQRGMRSEGRVRDIETSRSELLKQNLNYFKYICQEINKGCDETAEDED